MYKPKESPTMQGLTWVLRLVSRFLQETFTYFPAASRYQKWNIYPFCLVPDLDPLSARILSGDHTSSMVSISTDDIRKASDTDKATSDTFGDLNETKLLGDPSYCLGGGATDNFSFSVQPTENELFGHDAMCLSSNVGGNNTEGKIIFGANCI